MSENNRNTDNSIEEVQEEPSRLSDFMHKRLHESIFVLVFFVSIFLLWSLLSYERVDPSWFESTKITTSSIHHSTPVLNAGGWMGAHLSDLLLRLLGFLSYLVPFIAVYLAWVQLYPGRYDEDEEEELSERHPILVNHSIRWLGALFLILGAASLASFELLISDNVLPQTAGGWIGDCFSKGLNDVFNPKGTVIILLGMFFGGMTLLTGLSWIRLAEKIGLLTIKAAHKSHEISIKAWEHSQEKFETYQNQKQIQKEAKNAAVTEAKEKNATVLNTNNAATPNFNNTNNNLNTDEKRIEPKISLSMNNEAKPEITQKSPGINIENFSKTLSNLELETSEMFAPSARMPNPEEELPITIKPKAPVSTVIIPTLQHHEPCSIPPLTLLETASIASGEGYTPEQLETMAREVEQRLLDFGVQVQVVAVHPGPVITRFELQLAPGIKVSRISGLAKDLARSLSVVSVRVVDVIPGKPVIGLELPNQHREVVRLSEILLADQFQNARSPLSLALGVDISGYPVIVDLAKMPHLLVAGTTGSGKSVGLNAMLLSILFKASPEEVRLILVDPKMLEFSIYDRIPHLLTPVVTDMKEAAGALRWSVAEMERRYYLMSTLGVRNLAAYNAKVKEANAKDMPIPDPSWRPTQDMQESAPPLMPLPYIVVVIDELADMMMVVGKKVEQLIARIAQKARAAGIHLVLATQRPSVDVLTGLIKSNIPTRISFLVSSKIDSRTILDQQGAEQLLGHGDMLYLTPGAGAPMRIHGALIEDDEVHRVTDAWRERGDPEYVDIISRVEDDSERGSTGSAYGNDEETEETDLIYDEAVQFVTQTRKASISSVQRRFKIGYNRAARLIEEMERTGVVSCMESNGSRDVLAPPPFEDVS